MTLPLFSALSGAVFSEDRVFRYRLWRRWDDRPVACFCMLNPSVADENVLDPTLRRCVDFARRWGCGGIEVVNLFAIVSPYPRVLKTAVDPIGPRNDATIQEVACQCSPVVVGWGAFPKACDRAASVGSMLREADVAPMCLGINKNGSPVHPLMLPKTAELREWRMT